MITVALVLSGLLEPLETRSLDKLFELRGTRAPIAPIVIVTIDESSLEEINLPWPFPRLLQGQLIDRISAARPLAIGLDLIFDRPSACGAGDDEALGAAVRRAGNVVLTTAQIEDIQAVSGQVVAERVFFAVPLPVIRQGAAAVAHSNSPVESDAHIRRARLERLRIGDQVLPAFDAAIHHVAHQAGLPVKPLPALPEILINFRGGPRTFPWVPFYRVLRGEVGAEAFHGKIVLVGSTSPLLHDQFPTAFARRGDMPGVEIHANAIETLVGGNRIREIPGWVSVLGAVGLTLLSTALVIRFHALRAFIAVVALWLILALGTFAIFAVFDVWIRPVAGTLALVLGYGATVVVLDPRPTRREGGT